MTNESRPLMIRLPARDVILTRLAEVDEVPYHREYLHPRIANKADAALAPGGIVMMLTLAIADHIEALPPEAKVPAMLLIEDCFKDYISALVSDEAEMRSTLEFYERVRRA